MALVYLSVLGLVDGEWTSRVDGAPGGETPCVDVPRGGCAKNARRGGHAAGLAGSLPVRPSAVDAPVARRSRADILALNCTDRAGAGP